MNLIHGKDQETIDSLKNSEEFDSFTWESQFTRYAQILDTDEKNYVVLYQCLETAEYTENESGNQISPQDAWHYSERTYFDPEKQPINEFKPSD